MLYQEIKNFTKGLITAYEDHSIPDGSSSASNNWLTKGDRIELRKGFKVLGTEQTGTGSIDGIHVTQKADGTQVTFRKRGRKLEYYNTATSDWAEVGTDLFPTSAENDEASFANYASLAGNQLFISSPNSGLYKIMTANPGSYTDMYVEAKNFKGYIKIKQNRMFLWNRNEDKTGIYGSYIDEGNNTAVSAEAVGTGDGSDVTFSGTLAFRSPTVGASDTQFDITNPSGTTFRYTFDGTGTNPSITASSFPIGRTVIINAQNFSAGNNGTFTITGSGTNYFEVTNASGVAETNKTIGTGSLKLTSLRTCYAVVIKVDGSTVLTDDYNGNLKDSAGTVRGSINYTTGAYDITFGTAPGNTLAITADYQWEDSNNNGVTDFTKSGTRLAGEGFIFRQDDGGGSSMNVSSYGDTEFCFHRLKTWALTLTATDTAATNLIYRDNVGIPNWRASIATGDGIYFVDDYNQSDPKFRLLTLDRGSTQVIPIPVSDQLKLEDYRFDKSATIEWGDYVLFACRHKDSTNNNTVFAYNKRYKSWDKLDYYVACFEVYNGALIAGESITNNVVELFSGFDDNGSSIGNSWEGNLTDHDIKTLKKTKKFWLQGEISRDQSINIYLQTDRGSYVLVGTQNGNDTNVDTTSRTVIGSDAIGQSTIGGQTSTSVYNYQKEIRLRNGRYQYVKLKVEATAIGFASVSTYTFFDIIENQSKLPQRYRSIN